LNSLLQQNATDMGQAQTEKMGQLQRHFGAENQLLLNVRFAMCNPSSWAMLAGHLSMLLLFFGSGLLLPCRLSRNTRKLNFGYDMVDTPS
jgi:hypothetical protein